jgi:penicillin-insensitive murein endopeptidase
MTSGHQSHQIGLDIDIWMKPATRLNLSRSQRERLSSISVRSADQRSVNRNWTRAHHAILKRAAQDRRVDRIFVTAPVKIEMCKTATRRDRDWLQKIRPLFGHHYHFHVRLKCPRGDRYCVTQRPSVRELSKGGDGCDESLVWWVTDYLNPPKKVQKPAEPAPRKRGARDYTMADLPRQCQQVLAAR